MGTRQKRPGRTGMVAPTVTLGAGPIKSKTAED